MVDIKMNYHELTRVRGSPRGLIPCMGRGMGRKSPLVTLDGDGDGEFSSPQGQGCGGGEFPVDIWSSYWEMFLG